MYEIISITEINMMVNERVIRQSTLAGQKRLEEVTADFEESAMWNTVRKTDREDNKFKGFWGLRVGTGAKGGMK